jgi:preprotein translocase subunit SecY
MGLYDTMLRWLPQVVGPTQKKLNLGVKAKWTLIVLLAYFVLKHIPLFGLGSAALAQFQSLAIILGADFGSLISLGIGPLVTASIVMQLFNGAGIIKFDTSTAAGRARFSGTSKLLGIAFVIVESMAYVFMGGLTPIGLPGTSFYFTMQWVLIFQLILGGFMVLLLDDLSQKWGLGSGISLFIAAGVSESLFVRLFSWFIPPGAAEPAGAIPLILKAISIGDSTIMVQEVAAILATIFVFLIVIYVQSMKVEIPLSFGRIRGHGIRWPLNFLYTSNIPVILIAALLANVQLFSVLAQNKFGWVWAGTLGAFAQAPPIVSNIIAGGFGAVPGILYLQALVYALIMMGGSVLFAYFWMKTSGMDARSQAKKIMDSGLQIPGFRKDPRVMEHVLNRYIGPLTLMGGLAVGFLAALADLSGALTSGTGLLLAVMIVYKMYEDIGKQHMEDMNPMMRKFMGR